MPKRNDNKKLGVFGGVIGLLVGLLVGISIGFKLAPSPSNTALSPYNQSKAYNPMDPFMLEGPTSPSEANKMCKDQGYDHAVWDDGHGEWYCTDKKGKTRGPTL